MKGNRKGFTLIELLAVVVILLAVSVIAITSISSAIERNKTKQDNMKKAVIVSYGELYYTQHKNSLAASGCIDVATLNLTENERTNANGEPFYGGVKYTNGKNFEYVDSCS